MADKQQAAMRKRQLISKANRNMFITVAVASVVVGFSVVGSIFLFQKLTFNAKVIGEKRNTVKILKENNQTIEDLEQKIKVLATNSALRSVMSDEDGSALRVVPDALPATNNPTALAASLDKKLLNVPGLAIESIVIDPSANTTTITDEGATSTSSAAVSEIPVHFTVNGDNSAIENVISNLERSIRTIDILTYQLAYSDNGRLTLTVSARAFYTNEVRPELTKKEVKP
jgi:hypothetical protein